MLLLVLEAVLRNMMNLPGRPDGEVRFFAQRTKPLRGGKDRDRAPEPLASATGPIDSDFAPCLSRGTAPCYAPA